jgi:sugar/nucleoside kinase (ribokinase family)
MDVPPRLALAPKPGVRFDYITVGHVTRDVIEDAPGGPISRAGGGAFYSALQAARLGLRTLIVTQGLPHEIEGLLDPYRDELDLHVIPAEHTTTLSTRGAGAYRRQRLLEWAGPIAPNPDLSLELSGSILHFTPVAREGRAGWGDSARFVGITPQGLMRRWDEHGDISLVALERAALPARYDAAVVSEQEHGCCGLVLAAAERPDGSIVAVTAGPEPTTLHLPGGAVARVARPASGSLAQTRDDLGAGDVFAAAFFVELASGRTPLEAAGFAHAAAAVRVGGVGPGAIGRREQITP